MIPAIITIGDVDKGGWWFSINDATFEEGFRTEQAAVDAATAAVAGTWQIWYDCEAGGKRVMMKSLPTERENNNPP